MDHSRISYIVGRYLEKTLTEAEQQELERMLRDPACNEALLAAFDEQAGALDMSAAPDNRLLPILHAALASDRPPLRVTSRRRWRWVAAAALLALAAGGYFWLFDKTAIKADVVEQRDIAPGKQGAVLTLADGSEVVLDSMSNGTIARQNGAQLVLSEAQLSYQPSDGPSAATTYNTITTPKGRQFRVALSDGTQVWLNAASSLRYPTAFSGGQRLVEVTGEAYFEVAPDPGKPFFVNVSNKADIRVLGTHFNVNAYDNERNIAATLLEGSVRVSTRTAGSAPAAAISLRPGQQALISRTAPGNPIRVHDKADTESATAWKNGLFSFEGIPFADIMRQLERWYDIEVIYENGVPDIEFEGAMTRDVSLNGLLTILGRSGIQFRLDGRKLIVLH